MFALTRYCFTLKLYCGSQFPFIPPPPPAKPTLLQYYCTTGLTPWQRQVSRGRGARARGRRHARAGGLGTDAHLLRGGGGALARGAGALQVGIYTIFTPDQL